MGGVGSSAPPGTQESPVHRRDRFLKEVLQLNLMDQTEAELLLSEDCSPCFMSDVGDGSLSSR